MTLHELVRYAIREDLPTGDLTTESLGIGPKNGRARLVAKEDLVLSGIQPFEMTLQILDPTSRVKWHFDESDFILNGQNVCTIFGDLVQILKAERAALNFIGHLSGIATLTRYFVDQVKGTKTKILDTRKTLPGYRALQKKAVIHGGGKNHRRNLSSAILIKENHIALSGGITKAIDQVREHSTAPISVEARTVEDVVVAVNREVPRILLDNMDNEMMKTCMAKIPSHIEVEASGNMTVDRVHSVAELGVDYISVGALTHSASTADLSLLFDWDSVDE